MTKSIKGGINSNVKYAVKPTVKGVSFYAEKFTNEGLFQWPITVELLNHPSVPKFDTPHDAEMWALQYTVWPYVIVTVNVTFTYDHED